jgi:hypothetical protein
MALRAKLDLSSDLVAAVAVFHPAGEAEVLAVVESVTALKDWDNWGKETTAAEQRERVVILAVQAVAVLEQSVEMQLPALLLQHKAALAERARLIL